MKWLLLFAIVCAVALCDPNCPPGYTTYDNKRCYKVYTDSTSRTSATGICNRDGGYLSSLSNGFDNSYVTSLGVNASAASLWIGIACANVNINSCNNDDSSTFAPYQNFFPNNPSTDGNCVYLSVEGPTKGYWILSSCFNTMPFLCEVDYKQPPSELYF